MFWFFCLVSLFLTGANAEEGPVEDAPSAQESDSAPVTDEHELTDADLDAALASSKKRAPDVYNQSLTVWKNFKAKTKPNYVYRYWALDIVQYLKEERHVAFPDGASVGTVFAKMLKRGMISEEAAKTLTMDSWSHLSHLHGQIPWNQPPVAKSHIRPGDVRPDYDKEQERAT